MKMEIIGLDGELSVKGSGSPSSWLALDDAKDVTASLTANEINVTTRGSGGFEDTAAGTRVVGIDAELLYDPTSVAFQAVQTAYRDRAKIEVKVLDGTSGKGFSMLAVVTNFTRNEPLDDAMTVSVSFKKARGAAVTWID
jgi:hypothetical protein